MKMALLWELDIRSTPTFKVFSSILKVLLPTMVYELYTTLWNHCDDYLCVYIYTLITDICAELGNRLTYNTLLLYNSSSRYRTLKEQLKAWGKKELKAGKKHAEHFCSFLKWSLFMY